MDATRERSDAEVVQSVLSGDRDAYRLLVRRYGDLLYGHVVRMVGDQDEAADIVQEAFVTGYRKLASLDDPERVGAWLFRIAANRAKDYLRQRSRKRHVGLEEARDASSRAQDPERETAKGEFRARLMEALQRLTPEQREAFFLKHVEGRSYEEMARVLEAPVAALKMRARRARLELQGLLEAYR
ncbi:MAG: RNA polymerase sigma factor [Gemmatimonadota bacterium]